MLRVFPAEGEARPLAFRKGRYLIQGLNHWFGATFIHAFKQDSWESDFVAGDLIAGGWFCQTETESIRVRELIDSKGTLQNYKHLSSQIDLLSLKLSFRPGQSIEESISKASTNLIQQRGKRGFDVL